MIRASTSGSPVHWIGVCLGLLLSFVAPRSAWPAAWERGAMLGVNVSTFRGEFVDLFGVQHRNGFAGGVFATHRLSPRFGIQTEVLYAMKGARADIELTSPAGTFFGIGRVHWILRYLEVPVLARISLMPSARVRPVVSLGPSLGIKLGGTFRVEGLSNPSTDLPSLRSVDAGLVGGVGLSFGRGPYRGVLEARYSTGLGGVFDTGPDGYPALNSVITVMAGISH